MEFRCEAQALATALGTAKGGIRGRPVLPITAGVSLKVEGSKLTLKTTDLERYILIEIDVIGGENGECICPFVPLAKFLSKETTAIRFRNFKNRRIRIEAIKNGDKAIIELMAIGEPSDFPPIPAHTKAMIELPDNFRMNLQRVIGCVAGDESRPVLTSVMVESKDERLKMAASDGFRLGVSDIECKLEPFSFLLPSETGNTLLRFMKKGKIFLGISPDMSPSKPGVITFQNNNIRIISMTMQGTFPNYAQLIPQSHSWKFTTSGIMLAHRLMQFEGSSGIARFYLEQVGEEQYVRIYFSGGFDDEFSRMLARAQAKLEFDRDIKDHKIAVNQKYLLESLRFFTDVSIEGTTPNSPVVLHGDVDGLLYVVMPMFVEHGSRGEELEEEPPQEKRVKKDDIAPPVPIPAQ